MKKYLFSLTIAALLLTGVGSFAQCNAGFTWSQSQPNIVDFVNTSSPQNPGAQYYWYYGDTLSDYGPGPFQHTYYVPGVYYTCLYVYDSITQTNCSFCDTVTVTGTVLCNMLVYSAGGNASYQTAADGTAGVQNIVGGTPPYTYAWSNGATTQWVGGLTVGTYWCCVSDAGSCTTCDTVTVTSNDSTSCNAVSYVTYGAPGWINGQAGIQGVSNGTTVTWDFGDLTTASGLYAAHQYALPGTYTVCFMLADSLTGCADTSCHVVTITNSTQSCDASFSVQPDTINPNLAWIFNLSTGSPQMEYLWSWGDQTPNDTGAYPTHVYQNTGSYGITLYVWDTANNCYDSTYHLLWVPRLTQQASLVPYYVNVIPPALGITEPGVASEWRLFPNPANQLLHVQGVILNNSEYCITDLAGRIVQHGPLADNSIDVSTLPTGIFFFTVQKENGEIESKRFIKE